MPADFEYPGFDGLVKNCEGSFWHNGFYGSGITDAQNAVALEVAEAVVDLLEPVHVADHHGERSLFALATRQFAVEKFAQDLIGVRTRRHR